jgi:hypothetical protein
MSFFLTCSCGQQVAVQASQAGAAVTCGCGNQLQVPRLSKLREMAGKGAYEAGTIDTILRMLRTGELPAGERCAVSGDLTRDCVDLYVQAERLYWPRDASRGRWLVLVALALVTSPVVAFLAGRRDRNRLPQGRETIVPTPLRVSAMHQGRLRWASQRRLKRWLRSVPIYAQLLAEYPRARVCIGEPPSELGSIGLGGQSLDAAPPPAQQAAP